MKNQQKIFAIILIIAGVLITGTAVYMTARNQAPAQQVVGGNRDAHGCIGSAGYSWCEAKASCIRPWETYCTATAGKTVTFNCDSSKTITATFYIGDDKFVDLKLSDGRNMSVPHAMSASGARYANPDETFVFWNKGDTAFITEGTSSTQTFSNCALKSN